MHHPIYRITACEQVGPFSLRLRFNDGLSRVVDFEPILHGELFGPLRDPVIFAQVSLDPEIHTVVWPGALILTRPPCMTGRNTSGLSSGGAALEP